jgi:hypothetical protein
MAITPQKRKEVQSKILKTLEILDPSKKNAKKYAAIFDKMSDAQFLAYFKKMASDDNNNFYVEMDLYDEKKVTMDTVESAAAYLKLPLEEFVYLRHTSPDGKPMRSPFKVPVMYIHLKRMQQLLSKKNIMNTDVMKAGARSKLSGSLGSADSTGRLTDGDTTALLAVTNNVTDDYNQRNAMANALEGKSGDNYIIKELLGARADNMNHKLQMQSEIASFGAASLTNYKNSMIHSGQALNTLDVFLIGAGLKSSLITGGLMTKQGIARANEKNRQ